MATSGSPSRAWDTDVDAVDVESDAPGAPEISDADRAALAGFAAAWTRDSVPDALDATEHADPSVVDESRSEPAAPRPGTSVPPGRATVHGVGIPGRGVVLGTFAALGVVVLTDLALTGGLTMYFDLWFVVVCLVGAMSVQPRDLFTTGVLAPLAFGAVIAVVAVVAPQAFSDVGGFGKVFPTGLTQHAAALVSGYAIALLTVGGRLAATRR